MLPYGLETGIELENYGVVLPWGATREELSILGEPAIDAPGSGVLEFAWYEAQIWGGLRAVLRATLPLHCKLCEVTVELELSEDGAQGVLPRAEFIKIHQLLEARFGARQIYQNSKTLDLPAAHWKWNHLQISLDTLERFGEYVVLTIRRRGAVSR